MTADDPLAAVQAYVEAFNDGDVDRMAGLFDSDGVILDGMPPHVWTGPDAARNWHRDVLAEGLSHGASGYVVTVGEPRHDDVTEDRAYLALPATMTFDLEGTPVKQTGAFFTAALRRRSDGWRITAWAWTKGQQQ